MAPGISAPSSDVGLVSGPPIVDIETAFDDALQCLRGRIDPSFTMAVGAIVDQTGVEQFSDGGSGKMITQGAGDIVQSALFRAGVSVVNRRDPRVAVTEAEWGIRDIRTQEPVDFFISGSINSLDFIPGGGFSSQIGGLGPRYRQSRILVGMDLAMTNAHNGRIMANTPLQKQLFMSEIGFSAGRFFGPTLVSLDIGGLQREALHFTLRQMLNLATFELLIQLMSEDNARPCQALVDEDATQLASSGTGMLDEVAAGVDRARDMADQQDEPRTPDDDTAARVQAAVERAQAFVADDDVDDPTVEEAGSDPATESGRSTTPPQDPNGRRTGSEEAGVEPGGEQATDAAPPPPEPGATVEPETETETTGTETPRDPAPQAGSPGTRLLQRSAAAAVEAAQQASLVPEASSPAHAQELVFTAAALHDESVSLLRQALERGADEEAAEEVAELIEQATLTVQAAAGIAAEMAKSE